MIAEAATATFDRIDLDCGVTLAPIEVAYETYGTLNAERSNAILAVHAFSGDAHAAGEGGWWSSMIGPGKAFDTGKSWAMTFPAVTIADMVRLQKMLIDRLGIPRLLSVSGGSMGGMQALEW